LITHISSPFSHTFRAAMGKLPYHLLFHSLFLRFSRSSITLARPWRRSHFCGSSYSRFWDGMPEALVGAITSIMSSTISCTGSEYYFPLPVMPYRGSPAPDLLDPALADMILSTALIISTSTVTAPRSYSSSAALNGGSLVILQVSRHGRKRLTSCIFSRGPFPDSEVSFLPPGTNSPTSSVTDGSNTQLIIFYHIAFVTCLLHCRAITFVSGARLYC
jgi:hypothetical protein